MSPEFHAIIGSVTALAGLLIGLFAWLRQDIQRLDKRVDGLADEIKEQGHTLAEVRERLARLEGLIEGLFQPRPVVPPPTPP